MIISRLVSLILRGLAFVCAVVVMSVDAYLIYIHHRWGTGPKGREVFTECVAACATVLSAVWLLPFTWTFMHYPLDLIFSLGFFASFGILYDWIQHWGCKHFANFNGFYHMGSCQKYRTVETFCFISGILWLLSGLLSVYVFHKKRHELAANGNGHSNGATKSRWGGPAKSDV